MSPNTPDPRQLDLFNPLPPDYCGRGLGPCQAVIEPNQIRCRTCGCIGPYRASTSSATSNDALSVVLNGFMQGQLNFFKFLRERENAPGDTRQLEE